MNDRMISISKYLSKYLRHSPHELGLTLQPGGWVPVTTCWPLLKRLVFPLTTMSCSTAWRRMTRNGFHSTRPVS